MMLQLGCSFDEWDLGLKGSQRKRKKGDLGRMVKKCSRSLLGGEDERKKKGGVKM